MCVLFYLKQAENKLSISAQEQIGYLDFGF